MKDGDGDIGHQKQKNKMENIYGLAVDGSVVRHVKAMNVKKEKTHIIYLKIKIVVIVIG
jgi:hypothetical protein